MATRSFLLSSPSFPRPTTATDTVTGEVEKPRDVTCTNRLCTMIIDVRWPHSSRACLLVSIGVISCVPYIISVC